MGMNTSRQRLNRTALRQRIIPLLALCQKEIVHETGLSRSQVKEAIYRMRRRLGVRTRLQLVLELVRRGVIDPAQAARVAQEHGRKWDTDQYEW